MAKSLYRLENIRLAELLRQLREDKGMVQGALATHLGRSQSFVSSVELGIRRLDLVELRDYCRGLEIELGEVVSRWERSLAPSKSRSKRAKT